ncbi:MAG TPA: adenylyl cyclase [Paracoccaceae bacterium]|nr:adenylyl cyclase [Paracoccaceae bacterium]
MAAETIRLAVVAADAAEPVRIMRAVPEPAEIARWPRDAAVGLVGGARGQAERLGALRRLAGLACGGIVVTAGAREVLHGLPGLGMEYLGLAPDGADGRETELWLLGAGTAASLSGPVRHALGEGFAVAVLPFRAPGALEAMRERAWGLSDDVTASLTRFRELSVMARGTAWAWRASPLPAFEIGLRMGVAYVLDGVLRVQDASLRLDVSLIESATGRALWAERYLRTARELFGLQEEIADRITAAAAHFVKEGAMARWAAAAPPADGRAYDLVLRAQALLHYMTPGALGEATALADAALDLDPGFARALVLRARCANLLWRWGWAGDPPGTLGIALDHALRAVRADPLDARAHGEMGFARLYRREHAACEAAYETALSLNPNDADLLADAADAWAHLGRAGEALALMGRAMALNPYYPDLYLWQLGGVLFRLRRYGEAVRAVLRMQDPGVGRRILAAAYAWLGRQAEAEAEAARILAAHPRFTVAGWAALVPDRDPGETAHFAEGLRRAGLP